MVENGPVSTYRRFNVGDAMILVAATAGGCALARACKVHFGWGLWDTDVYAFYERILLLSCLLIIWTVAYLPLRLRRPRPNVHATSPRKVFGALAHACGGRPTIFVWIWWASRTRPTLQLLCATP